MNVVGWRAIGTPLSPFAPLFTPVQRMIHLLARQQRVFRALLNGNDDPVARGRVARGSARRFDAGPWKTARVPRGVDDRVPPGTPGSTPVDGPRGPEAPQLAAAEAS